jgi:small subunit ribosomal protein S4
MFDKVRIEEENKLVERYGLKNKREIWKADARIDDIRGQAKKLITSSPEQQERFLGKLRKMGLRADKIDDVLSLNKEDWLKRRLQSVLSEKKLAKTPKEARQLIAHKHVAINGNIVNVPSYIVPVNEEDEIKLVKVKTKEMAMGEKKDE